MKKIVRKLVILAAGASLVMTSCKKIEEATPLENAESTAVIEGILLYDNDKTDDMDGAAFVNTDPAVSAKIKVTTYTDIVGDGDPVVKIYSVGANGSYSFTVPTIAEGAYVEIEALDYKSTLTFSYNDNGTLKEATENGFYSGLDINSVTVYPGETKVLGKKLYGAFKSLENPSKL